VASEPGDQGRLARVSIDEQARQALLALAALSPSAADDDKVKLSIPLEWFRWLPASGTSIIAWLQASGDVLRRLSVPPGPNRPTAGREYANTIEIDAAFGERLAAIDQLRADLRSLRVGWLFLAGKTTDVHGRAQRIFQPLVSVPVRVERGRGKAALAPAGDLALNELVREPHIRASLERFFEYGDGNLASVATEAISERSLAHIARTREWAFEAAQAMGHTPTAFVGADRSPDELIRRGDLVVVAGIGVYTTNEVATMSHATSLEGWVAGALNAPTAFHALYTDAADLDRDDAVSQDGDTTRPVDDIAMTALKPVSPFTLTPAQRRAVVRARTEPITVVSGAPGTGKSHTITAVACDALGRGETVLVAAKSEATIDALLALFERAPGLDPVVFGSNERKAALARRLASGQIHPASLFTVERKRDHLASLVASRDRLHAQIAARLRAERASTEDPAEVNEARVAWPSVFDGSIDLDHVGDLIAVASHHGGGWLAQWRQHRATAELDQILGASTPEQRVSVVHAYVLSRGVEAVAQLEASGGLEIGAAWDDLVAADDLVRDAAAAWLASESRSEERMSPATLGAVAALATALRSGRAARRQQLAVLDQRVTRALPLWVGTLADIEDLLPRSAALFDVVILDEASSIDQPVAASALLRGRRGVIMGDPRQLRHVSFLSDERRAKALAAHHIDASSPLAWKLDVRRNSAFDIAAGVAPVLTLDEHFRSAPHLVDFVSRRFYDGAVQVATRSPATESIDCVDVIRVDGTRNKQEVVVAEVDAVIALLHTLHDDGATSVGVITPFKAQADALEAAVLATFTADELVGMDLRVGTVHAFQGNERDIVIASLGIGADAKPGSWRFAQDPHLFAVLVTRARQRFIVVHSADPPAGGLLADYVAQADGPPGPPAPAGPLPAWPRDIAADLHRTGVRTIHAYPTGRHVVDVCVGDAASFYGIECTVHPDGANAHIERHLSLHRAGWILREAFESRWSDRRGELLVDLTQPRSDPKR
jgi:hypothetical protein